MSFLPLIATIIAIILATSIIDIEAGLLVGLMVALISLQWVSSNKFKQLQRQIESLRKQLAVTTKTVPVAIAG
jgi:ABC-type transport system involved in cytochrome bd biosynthesis fused ATPase/permease subunit